MLNVLSGLGSIVTVLELNRNFSAQNDRMAADMAVELRKQNVACISLWPGIVKTDTLTDMLLHANLDEEKVLIFMLYLIPTYPKSVRIVFCRKSKPK